MRFLASGELIAVDDPREAERILARLRAAGYRWQGCQGGGSLWAASGEVCLSEWREGVLYLDGRVREDVQTCLSGG